MNTEQHSDMPDVVLSEIEEEDTDIDIRSEEETRELADEMVREMVINGASIMLTEMIEEDVITLREYSALTEYLIEQEAKLSF